MEHDDFELAMYALESIGEQARLQNAFWRAMQRAAQNMGLEELAARYSQE